MKSNHLSLRILPIGILILLALPRVHAQVVGASVGGTVTDIAGSVIAGASVTVRNVETGTERHLVTDNAGRYSAPSVQVGSYSVSVAKDGFASQQKTGITLTVGQSTNVDVSLAPGAVQQAVTVQEVSSSVNLGTQEVSGLVDQRQVKQLPLNGRSYDGLMLLNPATVNYTNQRSGSIGTSNSSVGNMFVVSGHRPQDNLFLLNGIEYTGASLINITPGGTSGQLLGVDAVREFNVVSDAYGAEYGKRTGAQISIVTASGTNEIHGAAYDFLRNSALDARNYFDQAQIPRFQRNQFGGAVGGPLRKNRLFLFGNYEGYRQNLGLSDVTLVPDNQARQGYVPNATTGKETYVGVAPSVAPLLSLWPAQNGPELLTTYANGTTGPSGIAKAYSNPLQHIREDFGTTRVDWNIGGKDLFSAVYTIDDSQANTPTANPYSSIFETLREQVLSGQEQHVFSPTLLNIFRVGFSRGSYAFDGIVPGDLPGWVAGKPIGAIVISGSTASNGSSAITQAGTNVGSNNTTTRNLFTYDDHIYYTHGRHQIEAGGWLQRIQANDNLAQNQFGQAAFNTLTTFLQGTVATFTVVPAPTELGWRSTEGAGFVQDTFKVTPRLEVRGGIRFESTNGWNEAQGRAANYLFNNGVIATNPFVGSSALTNNRAKFLPEPRVGFAYDVFGNGKTALRGSFAVQRALLDNLDYRLDQTAPFNTTQTLKNVAVKSLNFTPNTPPPSGSLISPSTVQTDIQTPTLLSYTLRVEQGLSRSTSFTVAYVGSRGYHQILSGDLNEPTPVIQPDGAIYYPPNAPKANPAVSNTTSWFSRGDSSYNGVQADLRFRLNRGLSGRAVYTYSKNLDDGSAWNTSVSGNTPAYVSYPANPKLDWGPAATDVRHIAAFNAIYELPFGQGKSYLSNASGWASRAVSGWSLSAIANLQSGFPFSPQLGYNPTGSGDSRNPVRPDRNRHFSGNLYPRTVNQYFNPAAFQAPQTGYVGNVGRDSLVGPGLAELDTSLLKDTSLTEKVRVQFRAEFFNVLNHTNFATPN
ncbi:MAG TPA: carboxypeptidase-like regulatory domain-containing protein, partial [Acidobacteriaceae bacterium]